MINRVPLTYPTVDTLRIRSRRGIPHFELDDGLYFITFRLADSLPGEVLQRLADERRRILRACGDSPLQQCDAAAAFGRRFDAELDRARGSCVLRDEEAAMIISGALEYRNRRLYELLAWSVMPNHVHVVLRLFLGRDLGRVMHSWKSFTANEINHHLGRSGRLWQREYFDRIARDEEELENALNYVKNNPRQIGIDDPRFAWRLGDD